MANKSFQVLELPWNTDVYECFDSFLRSNPVIEFLTKPSSDTKAKRVAITSPMETQKVLERKRPREEEHNSCPDFAENPYETPSTARMTSSTHTVVNPCDYQYFDLTLSEDELSDHDVKEIERVRNVAKADAFLRDEDISPPMSTPAANTRPAGPGPLTPASFQKRARVSLGSSNVPNYPDTLANPFVTPESTSLKNRRNDQISTGSISGYNTEFTVSKSTSSGRKRRRSVSSPSLDRLSQHNRSQIRGRHSQQFGIIENLSMQPSTPQSRPHRAAPPANSVLPQDPRALIDAIDDLPDTLNHLHERYIQTTTSLAQTVNALVHRVQKLENAHGAQSDRIDAHIVQTKTAISELYEQQDEILSACDDVVTEREGDIPGGPYGGPAMLKFRALTSAAKWDEEEDE